MTKTVFLAASIILTFFLIKCSNSNQTIIDVKESNKDSCYSNESTESSTKTSIRSEITCPECGYKKTEIMPTDVCLIKYTCDSCIAVSYSKDGDCCVFCSYGTHKCPSKQE